MDELERWSECVEGLSAMGKSNPVHGPCELFTSERFNVQEFGLALLLFSNSPISRAIMLMWLPHVLDFRGPISEPQTHISTDAFHHCKRPPFIVNLNFMQNPSAPHFQLPQRFHENHFRKDKGRTEHQTRSCRFLVRSKYCREV